MSFTFFFFFLNAKRWQKRLVCAKFIRNNVCLWDVQRRKKVSFEHKFTNYTYSKKSLEGTVITLTLLFWQNTFSLENIFFFYVAKMFHENIFPFFENVLLETCTCFFRKQFWHIREKPLKTFLKRNILKVLGKNVFENIFEDIFLYMFRPPYFLEKTKQFFCVCVCVEKTVYIKTNFIKTVLLWKKKKRFFWGH